MPKLLTIEGRTGRAEINQSIVEMLTGCLEEAKRGELKAIAITAIAVDGGSRIYKSQSDCFHAMLGAMAMLQFTMMKQHDEQAE